MKLVIEGFHVIEYLGIVRLVFIKVVKIEEQIWVFKIDHQIISYVMEINQGEVGNEYTATPS